MTFQHNSLGIDYSTKKVALAVLRPNHPRSDRRVSVWSVELPDKARDHDRNFTDILEWTMERLAVLEDYQDWNIAIEAPIVGISGNRQTAIRMAMVCGALVRECQQWFGTECISLVPVSSWKKEVCGKGNLDKDQIGEWLLQTHPDLWHQCATEHEVDAMCMALWAGERR